MAAPHCDHVATWCTEKKEEKCWISRDVIFDELNIAMNQQPNEGLAYETDKDMFEMEIELGLKKKNLIAVMMRMM